MYASLACVLLLSVMIHSSSEGIQSVDTKNQGDASGVRGRGDASERISSPLKRRGKSPGQQNKMVEPIASREKEREAKVWNALNDTPPPASLSQSESCQSGEKVCLLLFRQYVNSLLNLLPDSREKIEEKYGQEGKEQEFYLRIRLNSGDLQILDNFGASPVEVGERSLRQVHEIMSHMLLYASDPNYKAKSWRESLFGYPVFAYWEGNSSALLTVLLAVVMAWLMLVTIRFLWKSPAGAVIFLFILGCIWTAYEMYMNEVAEKHHKLDANHGQHCERRNSLFWNLWGSMFVLEDKCRDYYTHTLVDPLWKVSPPLVVSRTFVKFVVGPLEDVGTGINKLLKAVLKDLPMVAWPFALIITLSLPLILLFRMMNYRFRVLYGLFEMGPQHQVYPVMDGAALTDLTNQIVALQRELTNMRETLALPPASQRSAEEGGGDAQTQLGESSQTHRPHSSPRTTAKKSRNPEVNCSTVGSRRDELEEGNVSLTQSQPSD